MITEVNEKCGQCKKEKRMIQEMKSGIMANRIGIPDLEENSVPFRYCDKCVKIDLIRGDCNTNCYGGTLKKIL